MAIRYVLSDSEKQVRQRLAPQNKLSCEYEQFIARVFEKSTCMLEECNLPSKLFVPQSSFLTSKYNVLFTYAKKEISMFALDKIEGLIALYVALSNCKNRTGMLAVLGLWIKTHSNQAICSTVFEYVEQLFITCEPQGGSDEEDLEDPPVMSDEPDKSSVSPSESMPLKEGGQEVSSLKIEKSVLESKDAPTWLKLLSQSMTNWKLILTNPGFGKVSKLLSLLVTLGLVEKDIKFDVGRMNVFSIGAQRQQATCVDLIDAVFETVRFFGEGAYACFSANSVRPLLFSSDEMGQMEEKYQRLLELWEYAKNGNLKKFVGVSEKEFDKFTQDLCEKFQYLSKTTVSNAERRIYRDRWEKVNKIITEFASSRIRGGLRASPYTFKVFGASAVGKSTFTDLLMVTSLKACGAPANDDHIITLNADDKHMSNMRSYVSGIKIDDFGNTKMEYMEKSPSDWVIAICNNIKRYAVMADLEHKGKISIEPKVVSINTNVEDLLAHQLSNEPVSIGRRAHDHWLLEVKPEFQGEEPDGSLNGRIDPEKVISAFGDNPIVDIWLCTHRQLVVNKSAAKGKAATFCFRDDPKMTRVDVHTVLRYTSEQASMHHRMQDVLVANNTELGTKIDWCRKCNVPFASCPCASFSPQAGIGAAAFVSGVRMLATPGYTRPLHVFGRKLARTLCMIDVAARKRAEARALRIVTSIEDVSCGAAVAGYKWLCDSPYAEWTTWIPEQWLNSDVAQYAIAASAYDGIRNRVQAKFYARLMWVIFATVLGFLVGAPKFGVVMFLFAAGALEVLGFAALAEKERQAHFEHIVKQRTLVSETFKSARDDHVKHALLTFGSFAIAWGAYKVYKGYKTMKTIDTQGNLAPSSVEDLANRDLETNPWKIASAQSIPVGVDHGIQSDQWENVFKKCCMTLTVERDDLRVTNSFAFVLDSNLLIIPSHMIPPTSCKAEVFKTDTKEFSTRTFNLSPSNCQVIGDTDFALVHAHSYGPAKNRLDLFPEKLVGKSTRAKFLGYDLEREFQTVTVRWEPDHETYNGFKSAFGSYYELDFPTYNGLCMSPIVSDATTGHIIGFHIGGVANTIDGCAHGISKELIKNALVQLKKNDKTYQLVPQARDLDESILGKNFKVSDFVHQKSPTRFLTGKPNIAVYGSVTGRAKHRSMVEKTVISDLVDEHFGVPNTWDGPKFKGPDPEKPETWRPWQASLEVCSKPSFGFDSGQVAIAMDDYLSDLEVEYLKNRSYWNKELKPLSELATVSGLDSKKFIDGISAKTSMGYPIGGPKKKWMVDLDPSDLTDEEISCPREFVQEVKDEYARLVKLALAGESLNCIFAASLKDEPTPVTKDKVRVFQAAPVALQLMIRKYFLPLARFISMHPLTSECAVGINAQGDEWEQLSNFMAKYGRDRIIAGDYSKYDLRMPAQLTMAAFKVLIRMAKWSGNYSEADIRVMEVIASDVIYPLVAFNGDLIRFFGSHPSGQNLTAYINSIVNSLLNRLAFQAVYPGHKFRSAVALNTYGDDMKGSVKEGFDLFNFSHLKKFYGEHDIVFTTPDKREGDNIKFFTDEEADFLKRKNVYNEDFGAYVGCLAEPSIYKMLHSIVRSKHVSNWEVCEQNMDCALREWQFYGREVYEDRRATLKKVADAASLKPREIDIDFDMRVDSWKKKYKPQSGETPCGEEVIFQHVIKHVPCKCVAKNYPIGVPWLREGDLLFQTTKEGVHMFFALEVKANGAQLHNARTQVRTVSKALHEANEKVCVMGLVYAPGCGVEMVTKYGPPEVGFDEYLEIFSGNWSWEDTKLIQGGTA